MRNQNAYYFQQIRTNIMDFTTNYSGPKLWDALPNDLQQTVHK